MVVRLIKLIISIALSFLDISYEKCLRFFGGHPRNISVVVFYHSVQAEHRKRFARQLDEITRHARPYSLKNSAPRQDGTRNVAITFDDGFVSIIENAFPELTKRNIPFTIFIPSGCMGMMPPWIQDSPSTNRAFIMNIEQLQLMSKSDLLSVGSHCITHRNLLLLEDEDARYEIFTSKHDLENILQEKIRFLSFPYGEYNEDHVNFAKEAGYEKVYTILPNPANHSQYIVGRVNVDTTDWSSEFKLKIRGAYRWLPIAFKLKRIILLLLYRFFFHVRSHTHPKIKTIIRKQK